MYLPRSAVCGWSEKTAPEYSIERMSLKRAVAPAVGLLVAALAITRWSSRGDDDLRFDRCPHGARCTTVTVPERGPAAENGRRIALRVVVLPATGANRAPDPIFYLAGGPGQAASMLVRDPVAVDMSLRDTRDLVFVDQRGTGGSNELACRFYGPPDDVQSYFAPFLPIEKVRACRSELERRADLAAYTTAAAVADLEEVRKALGYERINLAGGSYGTRLAMEYVRQHGERVRTVMLHGPVPPSLRAPEAFGQLAQRALDGLLAECAADQACGAAFPQIRSEADAVFKRIRRGNVVARVRSKDVVLSRDNIVEAIRYMTYSSAAAARVPLYLHQAFNGDFAPIGEFLLRHRGRGTFDGLYLSITCAEDVPFVGADAADADEPTYLGSYRIREQRAACAEWPRGEPPNSREPVRSDVPVLITSGMLDPVTPPANGDEIARTLPNSLHLRVPFGGHMLDGLQGVDCVTRIARQFVDQGHVRDIDIGCVQQIRRRGFVLP
jgi:pimeloyl-ACP methyl ester carboxylesterase